jgi:serine/threonine protein kinase
MNDFKLGELLVKGDISDTYQGLHVPSNTKVFVIIVDKRNNEQTIDYERFDHLVRLAKTFQQPNMLQYHNIMQDDNQIVVIMEYPAGENLREYLVKKNDKRISETEAKHIFKQLISAVEYLLTDNIVHRNLNLRNIWVDSNQNIKIGDLLLCTKIKPIYKPHSDTSAYHFYAPECWLEEGQIVESSADIWSLGVLLYAMTCGCYPFGGKHELDIFLNVKRARFSIPKFISEECASLIRSMLSPLAADRPSIAQIKAHPWLTGQAVQSPVNVQPLLVVGNNESPISQDDDYEDGSDLPYPIDSNQDSYFLPVDAYSPISMVTSPYNSNHSSPPSPVSLKICSMYMIILAGTTSRRSVI